MSIFMNLEIFITLRVHHVSFIAGTFYTRNTKRITIDGTACLFLTNNYNTFLYNTCLLSGAAMTLTNTGIPFAGFSNANGV